MMFLNENDRAMLIFMEELSKAPKELALRGCLYGCGVLLTIFSLYGLARYKYITRRTTMWAGCCPMTIKKRGRKILVTIKKPTRTYL